MARRDGAKWWDREGSATRSRRRHCGAYEHLEDRRVLDSAPPIVFVALDTDTGLVGDAITSELQFVGSVFDQSNAVLAMREPDLNARPVIVPLSADGSLELTRADVEELLQTTMADGEYQFQFLAVDSFGNRSSIVELALTLDTTAPLQPDFELEVADDTPPEADNRTTQDSVALLGTTDPNSEVRLEPWGITTVSDGKGAFRFESVDLQIGPNALMVVVDDVAGNTATAHNTITRYVDYDFAAPELRLELLNDSGVDGQDRVTDDISLSGQVTEENLVSLTLDIQARQGQVSLDVIDQMDQDGALLVSQSYLEDTLGVMFPRGRYQFRLTATDGTGNVSQRELDTYLGQTMPLEVASISNDTGISDTDGVTRATTVSIFGSGNPNAPVRLIAEGLGEFGIARSNDVGSWTVDPPPGVQLNDGRYRVTAESDLNGSGFLIRSAPFEMTIDSDGPPLTFGLSAESDTEPLGDNSTTLPIVSLAGTTSAGTTVLLEETGAERTAAEDGSFRFGNIRLDRGNQEFHVLATDPAGNTTRVGTEVFYDFTLNVSEGSDFLSEVGFSVDVSPTPGRRTLRFDIDAEFDVTDTSTIVEDAFLVYLVDPFDPTKTLLDRGEQGTSLFEMIGDHVSYPAGVVSFDGKTIEIDVTSVEGYDEALVQTQLINHDQDEGSSFMLGNIQNLVDPAGTARPAFRQPRTADRPSGPLDLTQLSAAEDMNATIDNMRIDTVTGRYVADLRVTNTSDVDLARNIAVSFPNLPDLVSMMNASGSDAEGVPYVNLYDALDPGGLPAGETSGRLRLEFDNLFLNRFEFNPIVRTGGRNRAPNLAPLDPIQLHPGEHAELTLSASDLDGDQVLYRMKAAGDFPTGRLTAAGVLQLSPVPSDVGSYELDVIASDGVLETSTTIVVDVVPDGDTSTRFTGTVLNTDHQPLAGVPIELGSDSTVTGADGSFELRVSQALTPDATLIVRGDQLTGVDAYPFIAEQLALLLGREAHEGINNVIARPIYLPALDLANGELIDPEQDTVVTTEAIPGVSLQVNAGTLQTDQGNSFNGLLSITEVPASLTPAALPELLFPDLVVTIQPGELVFSEPAPLTLPNRSEFPPGMETDLWSINPNSGVFEIVGTGRVSDDGSVIETISGGIRSSSWHFNSLAGPLPYPPSTDPRNQDKDCDDNCEERDDPNEDGAGSDRSSPPPSDSGPHSEENEGASTTNDSGSSPGDEVTPDAPFNPPPPKGSNSLGETAFTFESDMFSYENVFGSKHFAGSPTNWMATNAAPRTDAIVPAETEVALHSGAVYKTHSLAPYQSLQIWRGLTLRYDSERANPQPIIHTGFTDVANTLPDVQLISQLEIRRGNFVQEIPGYAGDADSRLAGGEHFLDVPDGATTVDVSLQADMRDAISGIYTFESTNRFALATSEVGGTAATATTDDFVLVNTVNSPFGAGWGLEGLLEIIEEDDGTVLMIDGSGGENSFKPLEETDGAYDSPPGDFSVLEKRPDGTFLRTHPDRTVEEFNAANRLQVVRDRNGNETRYDYDADNLLLSITDPVGLVTRFRYDGDRISEIEDPAQRITKLTHDSAGNLIAIHDPDQSVRRFEYDRNHLLTSETDKRGHRDAITYDFAGRVDEVQRKDGTLVEYSPVQTQGLYPAHDTTDPHVLQDAPVHGRDAIAQHTDAGGNVTETTLDKQGQLIESSDGEGPLPQIQRDDENLPQQRIDGRGNVTLYEYDDRGNLTLVSDVVSRGSSTGPLFSDAIYAVGRDPVQVVLSDVSGDGLVDAIVANARDDSVSVLAGDGTGGFGFQTVYSVTEPRSVSVADVNQDTLPDVTTANRDGTISVLLAEPDGMFADAVSYTTGGKPNFVQLADLNQDQLLDAIVADEDSDAVLVMLGDGRGGFGAPSSFAAGTAPASLVVEDLDDDGWLDVVTADYFSNSLSVLLGNGNGTFDSSDTIDLGEQVDSVAAADLNGDGFVDLATTRGVANLLLLFGTGTGDFGPVERVALANNDGTTASPPFNSKLVIYDADNDGDNDIVLAEGPSAVSILLNDGQGTLVLDDSISVVASTASVATADLNLDGNADVVALGNGSESIYGLLGDGDGHYPAPPTGSPDVAIGDRPIALDLGDFNGDGHDDIVTANQDGDSITILTGDGSGQFQWLSEISTGDGTLFAAAGDLDGDGHLDLATANYFDDQVAILMGDGTGQFAAPAALDAGAGPVELVLEDLDADGDLDLVAAGNRNSVSEFAVFLNAGDATFAAAMVSESDFLASTVDVGDLDNDGVPDIVIGNAASAFNNRVDVRLGLGDGTFGPGTTWILGGTGFFPGAPTQVKLSDATGDGVLDIVGTDPSTDSARLLRGLGDGTFEDVVAYQVGASPSSVDVADADRDGIVDLVVANQGSDSFSVLLGNGDGTFAQRADFSVGHAPSWLRLVDIDSDGALDVITTNRDADSLSVRLGTGSFDAHTAWTAEYDAEFSQLTRTIDEEGRVVLMDIDSETGNTLSVTQVVGSVGGDDDIVTSYTYTAHGLIDTVTDPLGRVLDRDYDELGRLSKITFAVGSPVEASQHFEYDLAGNLVTLQDELGHQTEFAYDPLNRLTTHTQADPDGPGPLQSPTIHYAYDMQGNLEQVTDALGHTQRFVYDKKNRPIEAIDAHEQSLDYEYDLAGNVASVTDRLQRQTQFEYDTRNRLIETINAEAGRMSYAYDADNNVIREVDENNNPTTYAVDSRNRLIRHTNALGGVVQLEYDGVNNLTAAIDELNRRTQMEYDELDREVRLVLPDPDGEGPEISPVMTYTYDKASNRRFVTDALNNSTEFVYDQRDRLITQVDPDPDGPGPLASPTSHFVLDDANRLVELTDPLSRTTYYTYDDLNRLTHVMLPDPDQDGPDQAPLMAYGYDAEHNQTVLIDALGNATEYEYDELYRLVLVRQTDPDGNGPEQHPIIRYVYDEEDQLRSVTDPLGRTTSYEYDRLGRRTRETYPDPDKDGPDAAPIMTYQYDPVGNEVSMTDALGNVTRYEYDEIYRLQRVTEQDPDGDRPEESPVTRFEFDAAHQLTSTIDPLGRVTSQEYDDLGRIVRSVAPDPDGPLLPDATPITTHAYDIMGNQISVTDALGNQTDFEFDNLYRITAMIQTDPDTAGPQTRPTLRYTYDAASQLVSSSDPLSRVSSYEYDDLGRVVREVYPDPDGGGPLAAPQISYTFDLMGNQLTMTDAVGNITAYLYDDLYRRTEMIEEDPDGAGPLNHPATTYQWDIASQLVAESDPLGRTNTYEYDELGRMVLWREPDPDGMGELAAPETVYEFDLMNNLISTTDPLGFQTVYEYDQLYRRTRQIDEDLDGPEGPLQSPTTSYEFDLVDNILSITDPAGHTTTFDYDDLNREVAETIELGEGNEYTRSHQFDLLGNRLSTKDRNGRVIEYDYDQLYRRIGERWLDEQSSVIHSIEFEYDIATQLLRAEDLTTGSRQDYKYDDLSRVVETEIDNGGAPITLSETYDAQNRRTALSAAVASIADFANSYTYDGLNRVVDLQQIEQVGGRAVLPKRFEFDYNADDQLVGIARYRQLGGLPSDTVASTTLGYDGIGRLTTMSHHSSLGPVAEYGWSFDAASRITKFESSADGTSSYDYDNGDQLTSASHVVQSDETYLYDEKRQSHTGRPRHG